MTCFCLLLVFSLPSLFLGLAHPVLYRARCLCTVNIKNADESLRRGGKNRMRWYLCDEKGRVCSKGLTWSFRLLYTSAELNLFFFNVPGEPGWRPRVWMRRAKELSSPICFSEDFIFFSTCSFGCHCLQTAGPFVCGRWAFQNRVCN